MTGGEALEIQDVDLKSVIENETGDKFNREGFIRCPFHGDKTPSMSVKFFSNINKWRFKCWACSKEGDAIDFIMEYKNLAYKQAREYLGLENEKTEKELRIDKIKKYIDWQLKNIKVGYKLLGIFEFVDKDNNPLYYKAKFRKPDGTKETPYYHIEGDKVINSRGADEVPYNLYNVLAAIRLGEIVVVTEGEKDANTINSLLAKEGYTATSIKSCKDLEILKTYKSRIYVIGDTGEAGERYKWHIWKEFRGMSESFKFINLPGLKNLGDNKDVTDWLEAGNTKKDLLSAFNRSLDLKSKFDLQQDSHGIYKWQYDKKAEDHFRYYLTDFNIIEAKRMILVDTEEEGIILKLKSATGAIVERRGPATVFDDVRAFKNFLGTMDLAFKGKSDDVTDIKSWINKYWALENESVYQGVKFMPVDGKLNLITTTGAISTDNIDYTKKADGIEVELIEKDHISIEELKQLKNKIFKFASPDKSIPIVGTVLNNLAVVQAEESKVKLHHLLIIGESGSGKSTILDNVIAAILNYPKQEIKSIGLITAFALIRELSSGNYTSLFDEFKPSSLDRFKVQKLSETLRNLYDRATISRSDRTFKNKNFQLNRPLIMAGEESYPHQEKALIERSDIVYLSRRERTEENTEIMEWIIENEDILNKFGRSMVDIILKLSTEQYKEIRDRVQTKFTKLKNRPLNTAVNIAAGIELFNLLLAEKGISKLEGYEKYIEQNIQEEILDGAGETRSTVEQMIILFDQMANDGRVLELEDVVKKRGDGLFIRTSEMLNQICIYCNNTGAADLIPLKLKDFKRQAEKAGYLVKANAAYINIANRKTARFDKYNASLISKLNVSSIIEPEIMPVEDNVVTGFFGDKV